MAKLDPAKLTIGADPEFFLLSADTRFVSSIGKIGGSKRNPAPLGRPGFYVQEDNVAVEFNIPPAKTKDEFVESIQWSVEHIRAALRANGLDVGIFATATFSRDELRDPRAQEFGCDPDFNAWEGGRANPRPNANASPSLRSCGGHVHVGYPDVAESKELALRFVQAMDLFLSVPASILQSDFQRKMLYGKAGCFRPTTYGVEYRTLGNFWIASVNTAAWVYDQTVRALEFVLDKSNWSFLDQHQETIVSATNQRMDLRLVRRFMDKHELVYVP